MKARPNFLIAATINDALVFKLNNPEIRKWHVMTPRNRAEENWLMGRYGWSPGALRLPPRVRWNLRMRVGFCIDEESEEVKLTCHFDDEAS